MEWRYHQWISTKFWEDVPPIINYFLHFTPERGKKVMQQFLQKVGCFHVRVDIGFIPPVITHVYANKTENKMGFVTSPEMWSLFWWNWTTKSPLSETTIYVSYNPPSTMRLAESLYSLSSLICIIKKIYAGIPSSNKYNTIIHTLIIKVSQRMFPDCDQISISWSQIWNL